VFGNVWFEGLGLVVAFAFMALFFFLPTVVATLRNAPDFGLIFVINLFLGGTGIGWFVALYMAMRTVPPRPA